MQAIGQETRHFFLYKKMAFMQQELLRIIFMPSGKSRSESSPTLNIFSCRAVKAKLLNSNLLSPFQFRD